MNSVETPESGTRRDIAIIAAVCLFAFFLGLGGRSLFSQDVVRYAEMAREMIHFDSWLIPRFNGDVYAKKPAPYIWLIAGPSSVIGQVNEWTARLPSALAGLGTVIFTYLLGRRIAGGNAGLYSALSLVACYKFNLLARTSRTDMPFTFFIIGALYFLYAGIESQSKRGRYYIPAFIMAAFSVMMKGPAGIIILVLTVLIYAGVRRDFSFLRSRSVLWGAVIFVVIISAWLVPTCIVGGAEFSKDLLIRQTIGRFSGDIDHTEPFYYYFYKLPIEIAPLSLLLPLVIAFYVTRRAQRKDRRLSYLLVYLVVTFLFFQASGSRNIRYLLPLYPGIAVLFGMFWDDFISSKGAMSKSVEKIFTVTAVIVLLLTLCVIIGMPVVLVIKGAGVLSGILMAILLAGVLIIVIMNWKRHRERMFLTCFTAVSVFAYVFLIVEMDNLDELPRQVGFAEKLKEGTRGRGIYLYKYYRPEYGHSRPAEIFYFGRYTTPINSRDELREIVASRREGSVYLLTLQRVLENELEGEDSVEVVLEEEYMNEKVVLIEVTSRRDTYSIESADSEDTLDEQNGRE